MDYVGPEYNYKIEYNYTNSDGCCVSETDVIEAPSAGDAVRMLRMRNEKHNNLQIQDVWKESRDSWDRVHRDWWDD